METRLWAHPVEYSAAGAAWMRGSVMALAKELHPVLTEVFSEPVNDLPRPEDHAPDTEHLASPLYRGIAVRHEVAGDVRPMVAGDVEPFLSAIFELADEVGGQLTDGMFQHIGDVSDQYGQTVNVGAGGFVEAHIAALEAMDLTFDTDGNPNLPTLVTNSDVIAELAENPPTEEQQARMDAIIEKKREEWNASRRRQELP